jgi:hypothetical protein
MLLAVEANDVIALRMMRGGRSARREAELMVSEKRRAALEATAGLMAGASGDEIVRRLRRHVAANAKRLGKPNLGRSRNRALKTAPTEVAQRLQVSETSRPRPLLAFIRCRVSWD